MNMNNTNATMTTTNNTATPRSRFNPRGWSTGKKLTLGVLGAIALTGAWAAFRPELLFVNNKVSESLATGQNAPTLVSKGNFSSLAHRTEGGASLYKQNNSYILRLMNFSTSNGPDVHVYATQKAGTDNASIKEGKFLDLGVIKGNIGDQNYTLPASFDPAKYQGVSIWCKRFAVNFAGASFSNAASNASTVASGVAAPSAPVVAAAQPLAKDAKPVTVTTGSFHQVAHATSGTATIAEDAGGNRTLTLRGFKTGEGPALHLYLWKAENVKDNASAKKLVAGKQFVDLGALKSTSGTQTYVVPKGIDLWQYLAVSVWCDKFKVNFGTAPLSSPQ